ncbi:cytochrome P450 2J2-like [Sinocyclocheilus rhinocerous]|uniref:cytochrome P450 2J2-like n=1 Tax=Sinocyclocheilus rhinocerous TaxID=307959 RepID=UPI0007BA4A5F|nr:PREDICTED: cytochrome P450 2J2-like [Sinocyclocheilus rhinocerous]
MILHLIYDSFDFKSWIILFFVFLLLADIIKNRNPSNFPPGPWPLPFLGTVFTKMDFRTMNKLAEVYGNIFSLRVGSEKMVVVSGYKMVKEALVTQNDSFVERPNVPLFHKVYKGAGLAMSNGYRWRTHRKFGGLHLRMFGEEKKILELSIQQESVYLCDAFKTEKGPFNPMTILNGAVSNTVACLIFGQRFDYHDEYYQRILRLDNECIQLMGSPRAQLHDAFPGIMKWLPGPHQTIISNYQELAYFLKEKVEQHRQDWDSNNPRDYIDAYLTETEKRKNDTEAGFNIDSLVWCTVDLFEGGTETTTNTLRWALLYMIKYPDIQEKVRAEIDQVIGSRPPTMFDKANMHYINAFIHEVLRKPNLVPLNMARTARKNTTLGGYFIPKGTVMITNLTSVLYDKHEWETPDTFNPGHFLDSEGQF